MRIIAVAILALTIACSTHRPVQAVRQHTVSLRWVKSTSPGLAGYNVYRLEGGQWRLLKTVGPEVTETTDPSVNSGVTYEYKVRAFDVAKRESPDSAVVSASVP